MSRLHDMGGRYGDGPIPVPRNKNNQVENNEPTFKYEWHAKAWAITLAAGALGEWNLDVSRHYRECLPPKDYMNYSYYEKWLAGLTNLLVDKKLISMEELKEIIRLVQTDSFQEGLIENIKLFTNVNKLKKIYPFGSVFNNFESKSVELKERMKKLVNVLDQ